MSDLRAHCDARSDLCAAEPFRESDALRKVLESVMAKRIAGGLIGGEGFQSMRAKAFLHA
jgi:hypothetical protein